MVPRRLSDAPLHFPLVIVNLNVDPRIKIRLYEMGLIEGSTITKLRSGFYAIGPARYGLGIEYEFNIFYTLP